MLKSILQFKLKILAKLILLKYKPKVIGITGSVGKTSAKDAIATVLGSKFQVRANIKNYNNELGLPLTIIGSESPGRSLLGWLKLALKGYSLLLTPSQYPEILVLEMGIDKPGDMDYLNSIVKLDAAVITTIGSAHLANFGTTEKIKQEKKKILDTLDNSGFAILNYDNDKIADIGERLEQRVISYGFADDAAVSAHNLAYSFAGDRELKNLSGLSFKIKYHDAYIPVLLPGALSKPSVYAALAAASVGFAYGMNGIEISSALKNFTTAKGRMKLLTGINGSLIIDDTYNASTPATISAIETIDNFNLPEIKRHWLVLGDMLELGENSKSDHLEVGKKAAELKNVRLIIIGEESLHISIGAREAGLSEKNIYHCNNHEEIIELLNKELKTDDLVLVKGSQGMRMEKVVAGILANPEEAKHLLVRQGGEWIGK